MVARQPRRPTFWLAETKFHPPLPRQDFIQRRLLLPDLHHRIVTHPLTLISAPAGYGKTTLLVEFTQAYPGLPVAWLSLDEEDNDPVRFLTAFILALQRLKPGCGALAQSLLTEPSRGNIDVRRVTSVLINDLVETISEPFAIILDDFHRITEPLIFDALNYFLEFSPPRVCLVIATRSDPLLALARLRARGELSELRMQGLRFSKEETATFLNDRLHLDLSTAELALLQAHTEGWPAGLRLLAGTLDSVTPAGQRSLFIQHLSQINHNIFEFLAEEVFNRQEPSVKTFLLETAVLPELTPSLCQAVTQHTGSDELLEHLYHQNLFLVKNSPRQEKVLQARFVPAIEQFPLEEDESDFEAQYRYHDLFAEFLHRKLEQTMPDLVPRLHLRAARAESNSARAVGHFLAAAEWHEAAETIEKIQQYALQQGFVDTITSWINLLPQSIHNEHPRLIHTLGICALQKGDLVKAQTILQRAIDGFERTGMELDRSEAMADLAYSSLLLGDISKSETLYSRALTLALPPDTRLRMLMERTSLGVFQANWKQAQHDFNEALSLVPKPLDAGTAMTLIKHLVPGQVILPGAIDHMERISRLASTMVGEEISPTRVHIEAWIAAIHGWRGRWSEALEVNKSVLTMNERLGALPFSGIDAAAGIIAASGATGEFEEAESYLDLLFRGVKHMEFAEMLIAAFLFVPGRFFWMQNRLDEAAFVYAQMREARNPRELPMARVMRSWLQALLEISDGRYASAEKRLRQPFVLEQRDRFSTVWGCTRIMLARLYLEQNRQQEALQELELALPYYERMGWPGSLTIEGKTIVPLLQLALEQDIQTHFVTRLLGLLGKHKTLRPLFIPLTGQTLTIREIEVLELITSGATNRDIAEQFVISMSTVKAHVSHILNKLEVVNRTQATARVREWNLL